VTPWGLSSNTMQALGHTPRRWAAARKMSGLGLPLATSAEVRTCAMQLKICGSGLKGGGGGGGGALRTLGWAARFAATEAGDDDVAIAMGMPRALKNAIASLAPGISATPGMRAVRLSSHWRTSCEASTLPSSPRAAMTCEDHSLLRMPMMARLMSGVMAAPCAASARLMACVDSVSVSRRVPSRSKMAAPMRWRGGNAIGA
jgi:hypothetical protein